MWVFLALVVVVAVVGILAWAYNRRRFDRLADADETQEQNVTPRYMISLFLNVGLAVCCILLIYREHAETQKAWQVRHNDITTNALHSLSPALMGFLDSEHAITSIIVVAIGSDESSALLTLSRESKHGAVQLCGAAIAEASDNLAHPERLGSHMDKAPHGSYGTVESL